jgi:SEC-C motif-containing protein
MKKPCPCGLAAEFDRCCGRHLAGEPAPDPESLMRSRYTAYVLEDEAYLLATWLPDTRPEVLNLKADSPDRWLGLSVKRQHQLDDNNATVEFVARYKINGRAHRLHEVSRFERLDGRWYYRDGDLLSQ